jgi:hypothetical protein
MIKAEELRLGNYVMYNDMVMRVSEILSPKPRKDERYNNKYVIELFDGSGLIDATLDEISGISLDEDWFNKFSFEFFSGGIGWDFYKKEDLKLALAPLKNGNKVPCLYFENRNVLISTVHRLQNLYFTLNNKDLKL